MANFTITDDVTITQTLEAGETGIIGQNGSLFVTGADAIEGEDFNTLQVMGAVSAQDPLGFGEAYDFDGSVMLVSVTQTGSLTASHAAIDADVEDFASIINDGVISGFESGIYIETTNDLVGPLVTLPETLIEISNQGSIVGGGFGISIQLSVAGAAQIRNTGTIIAEFIAIDVWVDASASGLVADPADLPSPDGGLDLFNSGTISSSSGPAIWTGSGADDIYNSGTIGGDVRLAGGADMFEGDGGRVAGTVFGGGGKDALFGGEYSDQFRGGNGSDLLVGRGGEDTLFGQRGRDDIFGGDGDDLLAGHRGADWLFGDAGNDVLKAGAGRDKLNGGSGNDKLYAGRGVDTFVIEQNSDNDVIYRFKNGMDKINLRALGLDGDFNPVRSAVSKHSGNSVIIDLDQLGGDGSLIVKGLKMSQVDASDFLL